MQKVTPTVFLVRGDGDMKRVIITETVPLVDKAAREVQEVASFQDHLQDWLADL